MGHIFVLETNKFITNILLKGYISLNIFYSFLKILLLNGTDFGLIETNVVLVVSGKLLQLLWIKTLS